ncbi:MAG: hemerythrin domain-containing protein [Burkholderiaceae bacterium]
MMNPSNTAQSASSARAIDRIKDDHRALARVLGAMRILVAQFRESGATPDTELFESMLRYVENVPDRLHHPREDQTLFPAVRAGDPAAAALIAGLEREHARAAAMLAQLRRALAALREGGANAVNVLGEALDEFADFYWAHMRAEEERLLPAALACLSADDWERIERAFCDSRDPLFDAPRAAEYAELFQFIATHAPPRAATLFPATPRPV